MVRLWRRRREMRAAPAPPDAVEREQHAESVRAAQRAINESERTASLVRRLGDQVGEIADTLGNKGERNHFSEQLAAMLHGHTGNGGSAAPAPRRG